MNYQERRAAQDSLTRTRAGQAVLAALTGRTATSYDLAALTGLHVGTVRDVLHRARTAGLVTRTITARPAGGQDYRYRTAGQP